MLSALPGRRLVVSSALLGCVFIVAVIAAQFVEAGGITRPSQTADQGATGEEIIARRTAGEAEARRKYQGWLDSLTASGRMETIRALEWSKLELDRRVTPTKASLSEAVADAALVAAGSVVGVEFSIQRPYATDGFAGTTLLVRLDSVIKGVQSPGEIVQVRTAGGPFPGPEYKTGEGYVFYFEEAPILLPPERAVFLLQPSEAGGYEPQLSTGIYRLVENEVRPLETNPFKASLVGRTEAAFLELLRAMVLP